MEITLLEDPGCGWCWAFEPVITALQFEVLGGLHRRPIRMRRLMGGLRDRPVVEASFFTRHWQRAAQLHGMPFNPDIGERQLLRTTYEACRAVKAALAQGERAADRLLRRIREAFHVESLPIDDPGTILDLSREAGLDAEALRENLASGRAEALFERDRREAAEYRFGFPTLLIRKHPNDTPVVLNGMVTYSEVLETLHSLGFASRERRRFADRREDWQLLFSIHRRLTLAEIRLVSRMAEPALAESLLRNAVQAEGEFYALQPAQKAAAAPAQEHV